MQLDPYSGLPSQAYYVYIKIGILSPLKMSIQEHSREREEALRWDYVTCHSKALHLIDVNCTRPPQRIEMELHNNLFSLQENAWEKFNTLLFKNAIGKNLSTPAGYFSFFL